MGYDLREREREREREAERASFPLPLRLQVQEQLQNVLEIQGADSAFACIREDGSVVTWGHPAAGGDCPQRSGIDMGVATCPGINSKT